MTNTVLQVQNNGMINLPARIRRQAKISKGELFEASLSRDGTLCLKPKRESESLIGEYLSKRWQIEGMLSERNHDSVDEIMKSLDLDE